MIRNFFIVAVRNFLRQRTQSVLNVSGLAIGLTCAVYVFLYVFDELTYDTQHPDAANTYRLLIKSKDSDGKEQISGHGMLGWVHYMKENLKGVKDYSSLHAWGYFHSFYYTPKNEAQRVILSQDVIYAQENYADFFYIDLIAGDRNTLFEDPNEIAISESAARQLFGKESALNKELQVSHFLQMRNEKKSVVVKWVFRDMPENMQFGRTTHYILNRALEKAEYERRHPKLNHEDLLTAMWWPAYGANVYFQAEPGADLNFLKEELGIEINKAASAKLGRPMSIEPVFLKITDTHFSDVPHIISPDVTGNKQYIYIFLTIGAFILLISCINYTNLATARSMTRAKEVGMRKAMGSQKSQITFQFFQEAFLTAGLAFFLAFILAVAFLPYFSDFASKKFMISDICSLPCISAMLLMWVIVSVCSGFYPAFHIASFNTIKMLKATSSTGRSTNFLRQTLILFQFSISLILVPFTLVVINQMNTMINTDLNKAGDQILAIRYGNVAPYNKLEVLRNELSKFPDLSLSSFGNDLPRGVGHAPLSYEVTLPDISGEKRAWDMMCIGANYNKVFDLELLAGKFFDSTRPVDSTEILINEEAAKQLDMDINALIGQQVIVVDDIFKKKYNFKIRGVFKDFKYKSIHNTIEPLILSLQKERHGNIAYYIKLPPERIQENVALVEKIWKEVMPQDVGLKYTFLADEFNKLYSKENTLHDLARAFTILGLITTCIGLFGMSLFIAERRRKEIAIRKVMGANPWDVIKKVVVPFLRLMAIASLTGLPIAYYFSNKWLDNFVYKVNLDWTVAGLSVLAMLFLTLFTVGFESLKSANANPVNALKE